MAASGGGRKIGPRIQFSTREGTYKNLVQLEYSRQNRVPYSPQLGPAPASSPVKVSFIEFEHNGSTLTRMVFIVGRDLFYYDFGGIQQQIDLSTPLDKRMYKGVLPTCHDINEHTASLDSLCVAVGFAAGQVQIIDVGSKQSLQILNEERTVERASTTCVKWVPNSENLFISSHMNGCMYTYDTEQKNINVVPLYHDKPTKTSGDISIYTLKNKHYATPAGIPLGVLKNPVYKWVVTHDNAAIHEFRFSPDNNTIAIVSQDGYLRIVDYKTFEMKSSMKSYFGGLLCCCWSPDGRYIVTGGEDDLVTVWSFYGSYVIARGHGHRSWVSDVAFDKSLCYVPEEDEVVNWYGSDSPALVRNNTRSKSKILNDSSELDKTEEVRGNSSRITSKKDIKSPLSQVQNLTKRTRTDSTVSKLSKLSIAGSVDGPPRICYRFGSVGQDSQICLWEVTDETLFPRSRTVSLLRNYGSVYSKGRGELFCSHFVKPKTDYSSSTLVNGFREDRDSFHSDSLTVTSSDSHPNASESKGKFLKSNGSPLSGNFSKGFTLFSSKDSSKHHTSASISGKFSTLGGNEAPIKKEGAKEHKRNLSMPYFSSRSNSKNQSATNDVPKTDQQKVTKPAKTLGTVLCPRLEETAMLEPLVCKKITQGRLTCVNFQEDSIVIACQDGTVQTWARPHQYELGVGQQRTSPHKELPRMTMNSPTPSPKLSPSKIPTSQV